MNQEIEVLRSIYPELEFDQVSRSGHIDINVSFDTCKKVTFDTLPPFEVTYLPPLRLSFKLIEDYPESSPPSISLECPWLASETLADLQTECLRLWEHEEVLYLMIDSLSTKMSSTLAQSEHDIQELGVGDALYATISAYQQRAAQAAFERLSYECEICLEWRAGTACVTMDCDVHIFCKECLRDMFSLHIREGSISSMRCPSCPAQSIAKATVDHPSAVVQLKSNPPKRLPVALLRQVVSDEEVIRYQKLVRKQEVESMPASTHCPRDFCATVLARDPDEKLVVCTQCEYAFCADCKRGWHGPTEPCARLLFSGDLGDLYLSVVNDPEKRKEREKLERLYGIKNLKRLLHELEDVKLADKWRLENAQSCPACKTFVEKSAGCNHMICQGAGSCGCHFCFLCGDALSSRNPYSHYSDKGISCYGKLFEGLTGLEEDPW